MKDLGLEVKDLCISILEFKLERERLFFLRFFKFMYFYIRI